MNKKTFLLQISIYILTSIYTQANGQNRIRLEYDSITYSKNDGFFEYSVYDIFIGSKGEVFLHELEKIENHYSGGRKTQLGRLAKINLESQHTKEITNLVDQIDWENTNDQYSTSWSDQTTATLQLFNKGLKIKSVIDYGMVGSPALIKLYAALDGLNKVNSNDTWDTEELDIVLLENTKEIDSIEFVQHLKSEGSYYRNGVAKSNILKEKELKKFISDSKEYCKENPYSNPDYEILTSKVDKYSLFIYFHNGEKEWVKYDGKRFRKKTYLDFITKKNISKIFLK